MPPSNPICAEALTWYGTPYVHKGRLKGVATDCGGFVYEVMNKFYGPLPPFPDDYPPDWALHSEKEYYLDFVAPFTREVVAPVPGGITLFRIGKRYAHAAIVLEDLQYIHSWGRQGQGGVTITPARVMNQLVLRFSNGFPARHFEAIGG